MANHFWHIVFLGLKVAESKKYKKIFIGPEIHKRNLLMGC
jgi:hypothetical protein